MEVVDEKVKEIAEFMQKNDKVAVWLGVKILEVEKGRAKISIKVREDMLNAAGICQGGVIFSLADFAFALASNSHGRIALAISANIYFVSPALPGDELIAEAKEVSVSKRLGVYEVLVYKEDKIVAKFTGQVYRKDEEFFSK